MPIGQHADDQSYHEVFLADDDLADLRFQGGHECALFAHLLVNQFDSRHVHAPC